MLSTNESISFSKYGKTFQEKLAFLILDDRVFSDRMMEVLNVEFLEFKFLQVFVEKSRIVRFRNGEGSLEAVIKRWMRITDGLKRVSEE